MTKNNSFPLNVVILFVALIMCAQSNLKAEDQVTSSSPQPLQANEISELTFYKVKEGDQLGYILQKVGTKRAAQQNLFGKDSLVEKVISIKPNEKLQAHEGNLIFPGDIIYFSDGDIVNSATLTPDKIKSATELKIDGSKAATEDELKYKECRDEVNELKKQLAQAKNSLDSKLNKQCSNSGAATAAADSNKNKKALEQENINTWEDLSLSGYAFGVGASHFRIEGHDDTNNSDGTLLSNTNTDIALNWRPVFTKKLKSNLFYQMQFFSLQPEINNREVNVDKKDLSKYGFELFYNFTNDFNVMISLENSQNLFYRGLTPTSFKVDRVSLYGAHLGAGYRIFEYENYDVLLNASAGMYSPKTENVYTTKSSYIYDLHFSLTPTRQSHGFEAKLFYQFQNIKAEINDLPLDYSKKEAGLSVGYFINLTSTLKK